MEGLTVVSAGARTGPHDGESSRDGIWLQRNLEHDATLHAWSGSLAQAHALAFRALRSLGFRETEARDALELGHGSHDEQCAPRLHWCFSVEREQRRSLDRVTLEKAFIRVAFLGAVGGFSDSAAAQPQTLSAPSATATVRLGLPASGVFVNDADSGTVRVASASAALRFFNILEGETAVGYWGNPCTQGPSLAGRVGFSPSLAGPERNGWNVRTPLLFSYTHFWMAGGSCDGEPPDARIHQWTAATGFDVTLWMQSLGLNFRPLFLMGYQSGEAASSVVGGTIDGFVYGATLDLGVAVHVP